jgi:hypothetical protein
MRVTLKFSEQFAAALLSSPMADPQKCRDEAERLRKEAAESDSHHVRGTMLDIAELYYRLAETLEKQR